MNNSFVEPKEEYASELLDACAMLTSNACRWCLVGEVVAKNEPEKFEPTKPIRRWRESWSLCYKRLLHRLREQWPEGRGVREFVRILHLHQTHPAPLIEQALKRGGQQPATRRYTLSQTRGALQIIPGSCLRYTKVTQRRRRLSRCARRSAPNSTAAPEIDASH